MQAQPHETFVRSVSQDGISVVIDRIASAYVQQHGDLIYGAASGSVIRAIYPASTEAKIYLRFHQASLVDDWASWVDNCLLLKVANRIKMVEPVECFLRLAIEITYCSEGLKVRLTNLESLTASGGDRSGTMVVFDQEETLRLLIEGMSADPGLRWSDPFATAMSTEFSVAIDKHLFPRYPIARLPIRGQIGETGVAVEMVPEPDGGVVARTIKVFPGSGPIGSQLEILLNEVAQTVSEKYRRRRDRQDVQKPVLTSDEIEQAMLQCAMRKDYQMALALCFAFIVHSSNNNEEANLATAMKHLKETCKVLNDADKSDFTRKVADVLSRIFNYPKTSTAAAWCEVYEVCVGKENAEKHIAEWRQAAENKPVEPEEQRYRIVVRDLGASSKHTKDDLE